jgi:hypothetical protein
MQELLTFVWKENIERFKKLWALGECSAAMTGAAYLLLERGVDESLYQLDLGEGGGPGLATQFPPIWIRDETMHPIEED